GPTRFDVVLHYLDVDHDNQDPHASEPECDLHKLVSRSRAERARPTSTTESPSQPAPFAALDQDDDHQDQSERDYNKVQEGGYPPRAKQGHWQASGSRAYGQTAAIRAG